MAADGLDDPGPQLRAAAPRPTRPVDPQAVIARGETLRRRRAAGRAALVLLLAVPVLAGLWLARTEPQVDMAEDGDREIVPATLSATEAPPSVLADGSSPDALPLAVSSRFAEPIVASARHDGLAPETSESTAGCQQGTSGSPGLRRISDATSSPIVHVSPYATTSLAVGEGPAPPPYPDEFAIVCLAVPGDGGLETVVAPTHLYRGWTGFMAPWTTGEDAQSTATWMSALPVPPGASWAVQEHAGWWLAYDVTGDPWMLAHAAQEVQRGHEDDVGFPGTRVVFLDDSGRTVGEQRLGREAIPDDAPFLLSQAAAARIRFPDGAALRRELADGPVPACADEVTVCVWLVAVDGEIVALSAAGPMPNEVPPLGEVGWCSSTGRFQGRDVGSAYAPDGSWLAGPSQTGLHRYEVRTEDDAVVVDLARFSFGPEREAPPQPSSGVDDCPDLVAPGFPMP